MVKSSCFIHDGLSRYDDYLFNNITIISNKIVLPDHFYFAINFDNNMYCRLMITCILLYSCSGERMTQTDLYFGQSTLQGDTLTQQQWNAFAQQYISKVLPQGSTVMQSTGYWYDTAQHRLIAEPSRVVTSVNKMSPHLSKQIDSLRYWYKTLYYQQSVLRVDKKVTVK